MIYLLEQLLEELGVKDWGVVLATKLSSVTTTFHDFFQVNERESKSQTRSHALHWLQLQNQDWES